jgi:hypothetical protein
VFGLARNERLKALLAPDLEAVQAEQAREGGAVRRYRELRYRTLQTWSRERRVVGKAEQLPGKSNWWARRSSFRASPTPASS